MTNSNPPPERATTPDDKRYEAMREFGRRLQQADDAEAEAEAIACGTWQFLNKHEPDANRRAALWGIGRTLVEPAYDDCIDPRAGARAMNRWVVAMCSRDRQP